MKKRQQLEEAEATEKCIIAVENREMAELVNAESEGSMNRFMMKNLISKSNDAKRNQFHKAFENFVTIKTKLSLFYRA